VTERAAAGEVVHHLAFAEEWAAVRASARPYVWSTVEHRFEEVGFVHCALPHQVAGVVERHYDGRTDGLVVLTIDPARAGAELVMENTSGGEELFPHLYGRLTPEAVVAEEPLDAFLARPLGGRRTPAP
jgi:uncharacterized protein (DUF952 family)